uniref:Bcl-2-interacting killer n=1 Tax=Felis catus TaxID=9685 RepID=A0ABI7ZSX0_FELCA
MSHAGPLSRNVFLSTFLQEHGPEVLDVPGMTDLVEYYDPGPSPNSNSPDDVAMRLAFIGDEMEVRWMMPRVGELPGMAVYSLAFTYNQTGLRGVLRSLMDGLANLRENIWIWGFLTLRNRRPLALRTPCSNSGVCLPASPPALVLCWADVTGSSLLCPAGASSPEHLSSPLLLPPGPESPADWQPGWPGFSSSALSSGAFAPPHLCSLSGHLGPDLSRSERGAPVSPTFPDSFFPPDVRHAGLIPVSAEPA